eukprot:1951842-Amphidinium_carterae.1
MTWASPMTSVDAVKTRRMMTNEIDDKKVHVDSDVDGADLVFCMKVWHVQQTCGQTAELRESCGLLSSRLLILPN